jgi:hypothetical protein
MAGAAPTKSAGGAVFAAAASPEALDLKPEARSLL